MLPQYFDRFKVEFDVASALPGLRGFQFDAVRGHHQGLDDRQVSGIEFHVLPGQPREFATPEAGVGSQMYNRRQVVADCCASDTRDRTCATSGTNSSLLGHFGGATSAAGFRPMSSIL